VNVGVRASATFFALVLLGGLTKLVGFLREIVLAAEFGASRQMDAFLVAQTLPTAVQGVFDELLGASVLPLFAGWLLAAGERAAWARLNRLLRIFFLASCGFAAAAMLLARPFVGLLAPGLSPAGTRLAAHVFQLLAPCIALVAVATVCTALLNYYHRYFWTALLALQGNLVTLIFILLCARRLGIYSAALGMTLGALLVVAFQWRGLPAAGRREPPVAQARPWLAEFWRMAKPLAVGLGLYSLIPVVERFLASWLPEGNIALINYAFKVNWMVYTIFVAPLTAMVFPRLAAAAAAGDVKRFQQVLLLALKGALVVLLPAMIVLIVAGDSLVRLLYQRGSFTAADTEKTAAILNIYVLGLPGAAATLLLFYALYALKLPAGGSAPGPWDWPWLAGAAGWRSPCGARGGSR
jgi:putative peptidoglycan lipid II flippase